MAVDVPQMHLPLIAVTPMSPATTNEHIWDGVGETVVDGVTEGVTETDGVTDGVGVTLGLTEGVTEGEAVAVAVGATTMTGGTGTTAIVVEGGDVTVDKGGVESMIIGSDVGSMIIA